MIYVYLWIYLLILIALSFYISVKETKEWFLIANRDRPWWVISLSKFAWSIWVGYFIAYTWYAYEFWLSVYVILLWLFIWLNLLAFWWIPRIYKHSQKEKFYTQWDFVYSRLQDNFSKNLTNIIASISLFAWVMVWIIWWATIISSLWLLSYELSLIVTVLFVISYILISGFKAVLLTDVVQWIVIFVLTLFMTFIVTWNVSIWDILSVETGTIDFGVAFWFLLFWILAVFSQANYYQLIYSAKSSKHASFWMSLTIIPIIFITSLLLIIGMFMFLHNPNLDSNLVFIEAMKSFLPEFLLPFWVLLFFVWLMSSADSNIYGIASHYALSNKNNKNQIKTIRYMIVIIAVISLILGFIFRDVIDFTIVTACISVILSIPMIYIIAWWKSKYKFIASVLLSILFFIWGLFIIWVKPTLVLPTILGAIVWLFYFKRK